jgi:hypothetical protein
VQGRKRVVSREVQQVESANRQAADMTPESIIEATGTTPSPIDSREVPVVVDPTTLGRRHRRSSHHRIYRWTQACSMLGALLAAVSVICTLFDDILLSRWLAAPALALAFFSIALSGQTSLSARWRGWAIAATVFAAVALGLTWLGPTLTHEDPTELTAPRPPRQQPPANP